MCFPHHFSHSVVMSAPLPRSLTPSQPPDPPSLRHAGSQLLRSSTHTQVHDPVRRMQSRPLTPSTCVSGPCQNMCEPLLIMLLYALTWEGNTHRCPTSQTTKPFNAHSQLNLDFSCNFHPYMELNLWATRESMLELLLNAKRKKKRTWLTAGRNLLLPAILETSAQILDMAMLHLKWIGSALFNIWICRGKKQIEANINMVG